MRCIKCNTENPLNSIFCDFCGIKLEPVTIMGQSKQKTDETPNTYLAQGHVLQERYAIYSVIKQGGMSTIYLATDMRFTNRKCIVKEMQDNFDNQEEREFAVVSFHNEADMLARLNHPAIPKVYDRFTELNKRHYLVLEYVSGSDLEDYLKVKGGVLGVDEIFNIVIQVCDVLQYLHSQPVPIVYRDLKPENLLRDDSGRIKLIDFGIARFFNNRKKESGYGTPGYAAPEQYDGIPEPRTDLFALGAIMHYFCTGCNPQKQKPFTLPAVTRVNSGIPQKFAELIESCLALDIARRPRSAEDIARYIESIRTGETPKEEVMGKEINSNKASISVNRSFQQAFEFKNGDKATTIMEWIMLCDRWREEGQEYFSNGMLESWLETVGNTVVLEKLVRFKKENESKSIALEKFMQAVGVVDTPQLTVNIYALNFNNVTLGEKSSAHIRVINKGRGYLYGELATSNPDWLLISSRIFEGNDQEVNIVINTSRQTGGGALQGSITVMSNGGEVVIPVTVQVLEPKLIIQPERVVFQLSETEEVLPQKVRLGNVGAGEVYGSLQVDANWLYINKVTFRGETEFEVGINASALPTNFLTPHTLNSKIIIKANTGEVDLPVLAEIKPCIKKSNKKSLGIAVAVFIAVLSAYMIGFDPFHYWHRLMWTFSLKSKVTEAVTVENGIAYFGTDGYRIYAVNAKTGVKKWMYITSAPVSTALCRYQDYLYFGTEDGRLHALNLKSGVEKWRFMTGGVINSTPIVSGQNIYFGSQDNKFYAIDLATGKQKWCFVAQWGVSSSASVSNGMVYFGSEDNKLYALSLEDGRLIWNFETGGVISSKPLVYGKNIYFGSEDGKVYALDALDGKKKWEFASDGLIASSPTTDGQRIYFGSYDRKVYALDMENGQKKWEFETGGWIKSSPIIQSGVAYFGSYDKNFYAVSTKDGKMKWKYATEGWIDFSPQISDGVIYFSSYGRNVYALNI